ncbi:integrase family protein [Caballeronia novacaledonica]|uniref:Integrase family protein n=1 Tax=Caballeronia novacaledonica TaxID=1544861 RepID=A0A2U3I7H8_9BURK|nr:site-specific integrase [Caballeronia novacaledonica]SPB16079.1 integrase family protein [Caballeronia novacaledonica]
MSENSKTEPSVVRSFPVAPNRKTLTFREVCDAYMAAYDGRDIGRAATLAVWLPLLGADTLAAEICSDDIADALEVLAQTPVRKYMGTHPDGSPHLKQFGLPAPATVNRKKAVLSAVLTWAVRRRLMPRGYTNPCREVESHKVKNARTRFLTNAERDRLLRVCRISSWDRLYLLILLALTTGARKSELLTLRYRQLDLERSTAHLFATKNDRERVLPLPANVIDEIRRFGRPPSPDALLFPSRYRPGQPFNIGTSWTAALRTARIENFRFHDLRHCCASLLAQSGASLIQIADVLGHQSTEMAKRYSHLTLTHKAELVNRVLGDIR